MIRKGSDNNPPPGIVMQEINPQKILRVISYTQMVIKVSVGILALRVLLILNAVLRRRKLNRHLACRFYIEWPAVLLAAARECDLLWKL